MKKAPTLLVVLTALLVIGIGPAWSGDHPYPGATRTANNAPFYVDVWTDLTGTINYKVPADSEEGEFNVHCKEYDTVEIDGNTAHITGSNCRIHYDEGTDLDVTFIDNGPEGDYACFIWTYLEDGEIDVHEDCGTLLRGNVMIGHHRVLTFQK